MELFNLYNLDEIWIPIKELNNEYGISNLGRVKAFAREVPNSNGGVTKLPERIIKLQKYNSSLKFTPSVGGVKTQMLVKPLVVQYFLHDDHNLYGFEDGNSHNCSVNNLVKLYQESIPDLPKEKWKPIPEFPEYLVSNMCRVKSTERMVKCMHSQRRVVEKLRKLDKQGYLLITKNKKQFYINIRRTMYALFIRPLTDEEHLVRMDKSSDWRLSNLAVRFVGKEL